MRYLIILLLLWSCKDKPKTSSGIPKPVDTAIIEKSVDHKIMFNWPDRRPIGMIMLASHTGNTETDNYVTTDFLGFADACIENMKYMNAQGMITWDIEGQKFPHPASYLGDPSFIPEPFAPIADRFYEKFRDAGFKVGLCIRPDSIAYNKDSTYINHWSVKDPYQNLHDKIKYSIDRWGCSIFYIDSNIWPGKAPMDVSAGGDGLSWWVFKRLHDAFPDVLLVPEWQEWNYFQCTAPFYSSAEGSILLSEEHKRILPNSFIVAAVDQNSTEIEASVKQGNVMLFAAWWKDPNNERIKLAYEQAQINTGGGLGNTK